MMPDDKSCWPSHGEIDIMEMVNGDGLLHSTYHWQVPGGCGDKPKPHPSLSKERHIGSDWATAQHEYAVEYSPDHIRFALDGVEFEWLAKGNSSHLDPVLFFDTPYYMILNTAVGEFCPCPSQ